MRSVVLGAGPLGKAVADQLQTQGESVVLYSIMGNRSYDMPGTSPAAIDGADPMAISEACRDADLVFLLLNAHYVDWYGLYPPRLGAAIDAAESTGSRLVYHDNIYMYGRADGPLTEDTPHDAATRKGRLRSQMAHDFLEAVDSRRITGVIGRSPDMYGPGAINSSFNSTLGQRHFYPLLAGHTVSILGNAKAPHAYGYVPDVASALITLARDPMASGVWHLPSAPALSHRELLTIAAALAGAEPRIRSSALSGFFLRLIGAFQRDVAEVAETLYLFSRPLLVSHEKYAGRFAVEVTPHEQALGTTLDWYRNNPL